VTTNSAMPRTRDCWEIDASVPLDVVLDWCLRERGVDHLLVTARASINNPAALDEPQVERVVVSLLADALLESLWASAWPGTQLFKGGASKVFIAKIDNDVRNRMVSMENQLSAWHDRHDPPLPSDLSLYRSGDTWPTLVSVTHDVGWFGAWLFGPFSSEPRFAMPGPPLPQGLVPAAPTFLVPARKHIRRSGVPPKSPA
jgi:hypothetical protein